MKITETVTETIEKVIGYKCDLCKTDHLGLVNYGKGTLHQTLEDGCDDTYTKWVDLCLQCTDKVFGFITDGGGRVNSDY
jgi:hypothetical protein